MRGGALAVIVRLTPKSARDEIAGVDHLSDGRPVLKARVRAAPQNGEANAALLKLVAKSLRIPAGAVRLESGASGRLKTLILSGDAEALKTALTTLVGSAEAG
ncbi:DUF167 family protein [Methylocella tundrae]|nr:DUF167 family protein [Methylocella tundrae]WPP06024.1 DUF167 family protein [Methylocella tundrae]